MRFFAQQMKNKGLLVLSLIILTGLMLAPEAKAIIIDGDLTGGSAQTNGGVFQKLIPPIGNVGNNNHQSNNLFGFDEDQNIVIPAVLGADVGLLVLPIGTEVASHYVFFDPDPSRQAIGYVEFDSEVLAIMTSLGNLTASDFLANVSANYLSPALRGLEAGDIVTIDGGNPNRINIDFTASNPGDYIRVLTKHSRGGEQPNVPEPATMALMGIGLTGLALKRIRRKASK